MMYVMYIYIRYILHIFLKKGVGETDQVEWIYKLKTDICI